MRIVLFWKDKNSNRKLIADHTLQASLWMILMFLGSFTQTPVWAADSQTIAQADSQAIAQTGAQVTPQTDAQIIEGLVREKGTRKPLGMVNVYCVLNTSNPPAPNPNPTNSTSPASPMASSHPLKATTDAQGKFTLQTSEPCHWVINLAGYERKEVDDSEFVPGLVREFFLERSNYHVYETTVYAQKEKRDDNTKSISATEVTQLAGSGNDPVKAVQNFPGVARASFLSSNIAIEGSDPSDTQYFLDNIDVPIILHFGGLYSIIMPEATDRVDFLPAGFGPEYSRTTAGYVGIWTKDPAQDRLHGIGYVDTFKAGALVESPIDNKSSFLLSARTTYFGPVLKAIAANSPSFNLVAAPDFSDTLGVYKVKLSPQDTLKVTEIGSVDNMGFVLTQPSNEDPSIRGNFSFYTSFFRVIPQWVHRVDSKTVTRLSVGAGKNWIYQDFGSSYFNQNTTALSTRGEVETQATDWWKTYVGFDNNFTWNLVDLNIPVITSQGGVSSPFSLSATRQVNVNQSVNDVGVYWRNTLHSASSPWTISPGLRTDYYNTTGQVIPMPRIALRYAITPTFSLKSANGLYSQPPSPQQVNSTIGNPNLQAPEAWHFTFGAIKDFRNGSPYGWSVDTNLFYKYFERLVESTSAMITNSSGNLVPEYYTNSGTGRAYGAEVWAKYDFSTGLSGWISYTLSRSTRTIPPQPESLFEYDQTHIFTIIANQILGRNWLLSSRLRYVTGNPYTPIVGGTFDADNDVYVPTAGAVYSQRLTPFFQIDFRAEKKWIFNRWILTAYLDILNVTNHQNEEELIYSYNYQQTATIAGLPFLPTFGFKGEF